MLPLFLALLTPAMPSALPEPTALIRVDDERHDDRKGRKHEDKKREKHERKAWKEREKLERKEARHRYHEHGDHDRDDHRDWDAHKPRHRHVSPPWMSPWWGTRRDRHYVALVPNDPSRIYVFLDGRWVMRRVQDSRWRVDVEGAFRLPAVPPPAPPPSLGLNLHIVLFD